jgi:hypothetical protein
METVATPRTVRWAFGLVFLVSAALIIAAARGDLWLDEIWSLGFARDSHSVADVFVRFHHDNNHPLNTVFLYWVGNQQALFVCRLLAVFSGIGSVALAGYIAGNHWGRREAWCSMVLVGTSYPLLLYSSEARGYAPAIFFALAACAVLGQNLRRFRLSRAVLFWATSILGMLSHSTFIMASVAFCLWNLADETQAAGSLRQKVRRFAVHHGPPLVFFAWWYAFFLRDMEIGGGPVYSKWSVVAQASALLLGFPQSSGFAGAAVAGVLVAGAAGVVWLFRERDPQWLFFLTLLGLAPALMVIVTRPTYLYFRYFIVCFPFFYLLLSRLVCRCFRAWPTWARWLPVAALAVVMVGQTPRVFALVTLGRGNYSAALARIAKGSTQAEVRVGGDNDFQDQLLFDFYLPRVPGGSRLRYVGQARWGEAPPDWFIVLSQDVAYRPPREIAVHGLGRCQLAGEYPFSGISGWSWFVFRRESPGGPAE